MSQPIITTQPPILTPPSTLPSTLTSPLTPPLTTPPSTLTPPLTTLPSTPPSTLTPPLTTPPSILTPSTDHTGLQLTPIIYSTGGGPIANQKWDGTQYVKVSNPADFIVLTKSTDPNITKYSYSPSHINNVVDMVANAKFNPLAGSYSFNVQNARAISDLGLSCYFVSSLQYLFLMHDVRSTIVSTNNYLDLPLDAAKIDAYGKIKKILIDMDKTPKTTPVSSSILPKTEYLKVKSEFTPSNKEEEEDAVEFLTNYMKNLSQSIVDISSLGGNDLYYNAFNKIVVINKPQRMNFFDVIYNIIDTYPSITVEEAMARSYEYSVLMEGDNSIAFDGNYMFGYRHYEITSLPQYLNICLLTRNDHNVKKLHNLKINTTLTLTTGTKTIHYFFLAMIIHIGSGVDSGHYTSLCFDNRDNGMFTYIYYDNDIATKSQTPDTAKFIPEAMYKKGPNYTPYALLYGDITKLA